MTFNTARNILAIKFYGTEAGKEINKILNEVDESHWHTGTPTEEGWYVLHCTNGLDDYHVNRLEWKEYGLEWRYNFIGEIISWMPFEPFKED